jgi:uncharacterized protein (DUF2384 family)
MKSRVCAYAIQVFGSNKLLADLWLESENPVFNGKTPLAMLESDKGCEQVMEVLGSLETVFREESSQSS